jgi:predicted DNA-binding protein (MmcQ/YjbR family)
MTIDQVREFCRGLDGTTEDIKWGSDLVFSVGGKMYVVVCLDPPHTLAFKCSPDTFAELVERDGVIPAPYLARAMWVQEKQIGTALNRSEREHLIASSYELVKAKLPKKRTPARRKRTPARTRAKKRTTK